MLMVFPAAYRTGTHAGTFSARAYVGVSMWRLLTLKSMASTDRVRNRYIMYSHVICLKAPAGRTGSIRPQPSTRARPAQNLGIKVYISQLTARASPQAWLRVALGFHSAAQVLAGAALGAATAAAWHRLGAERALPAVARQPALAWALRGTTALALALFALRIVLQWARPRARGGGRRESAVVTL